MHCRGPCKAFPKLYGLLSSSNGVAAVEFAIILPFMLTLYLGSIEIGEAMSVQFKAATATRAAADLASQYSSINNSTMTGILGAALIVVAPYSTANMVVTVSEITTNSSGLGTVTWSDALNGAAHTVGQSVTLPAAMQIANTTMIWGEVTYPYHPMFGYALTGTINMYQSSYFLPRLSTSVTRVNS